MNIEAPDEGLSGPSNIKSWKHLRINTPAGFFLNYWVTLVTWAIVTRGPWSIVSGSCPWPFVSGSCPWSLTSSSCNWSLVSVSWCLLSGSWFLVHNLGPWFLGPRSWFNRVSWSSVLT